LRGFGLVRSAGSDLSLNGLARLTSRRTGSGSWCWSVTRNVSGAPRHRPSV